MTTRALDQAGIAYRTVDLSRQPAALEFVTGDLGYSAAPVVVVDQDPEHHWSGFQPAEIATLTAKG